MNNNYDPYSWNAVGSGALFILRESRVEKAKAAQEPKLLTPWARNLAIKRELASLYKMEVVGEA